MKPEVLLLAVLVCVVIAGSAFFMVRSMVRIFPMLDFCLDVVAQLPANARQSPAPNPLVQWRIAEGAGNDAQ